MRVSRSTSQYRLRKFVTPGSQPVDRTALGEVRAGVAREEPAAKGRDGDGRDRGAGQGESDPGSPT